MQQRNIRTSRPYEKRPDLLVQKQRNSCIVVASSENPVFPRENAKCCIVALFLGLTGFTRSRDRAPIALPISRLELAPNSVIYVAGLLVIAFAGSYVGRRQQWDACPRVTYIAQAMYDAKG